MADRLDILLQNKRDEERALLERLHEVRLVIETLEEGAGIAPERPRSQAGYVIDLGGGPPKKGGRQKGAISNTWRLIFQEMVNSGHPNTPEEIKRFAFTVGLKLTDKSVRTRARDHLKAGFFELKNDGYWVTDNTVKKFGLNAPK